MPLTVLYGVLRACRRAFPANAISIEATGLYPRLAIDPGVAGDLPIALARTMARKASRDPKSSLSTFSEFVPKVLGGV